MEQTNATKIPGVLLALDFRKAFDTLEWTLTQYALQKFNFGEGIRRWVEIFYNDVESTILNNGFATNWIKPTRGVRQGCPLSPFLFVLSAELMANKIRQSHLIKGVSLFGNEIKLSQFADDTNLVCSDLLSVEKALQILDDFGDIPGLRLNKENTQAMWLGPWANKKVKPLGLKWVKGPARFLGIYLSYDKNGNNVHNFGRKMLKLRLKLDIWRTRDLTLFGRVLIMKSLGISQLVYSISNVEVPGYIASTLKSKLFGFLWKNKKDKIKRVGLYQNYERGGLRMTDVDSMIKALRLAWIPRLLRGGHQNWKSVPYHFFDKYGGLRFILNCNYDVKYFEKLPNFYKEILKYFSDLKALYNSDLTSNRDIILFNNKEILIGRKPFFNKEWFAKGIRTINDILDNDCKFLSFESFQNKFGLTRTNFLQFYQVIHAIPKNLVSKVLATKLCSNSSELESNSTLFDLEPEVKLNLTTMKSREFYSLFVNKSYAEEQTGVKRWSKIVAMDKKSWQSAFASVRTTSKDMKLREFHFKFLHRMTVTKKELFRSGLKADCECLYCGEPDSIDHTFIQCQFSQRFIKKIVQWFNQTNKTNFNLGQRETLFGVLNNQDNTRKLFNYTMLFMRYFIYKCKLKEDALRLPDFINKLNLKLSVET
ncbi:LINE-1 retrotransposable element ORF2 protein [Acropora cervicornis]|uniref:LINE-1 retrotransposable element ORF2 protein n=1 Tax=Acropora cervicornis TaxID=6130 RepID=A0AAD9VDK5_ACRCE|nr:LINE-1 retrotransposable element ORF2 protein [Acropora cervicornis]